MTIVLGTPSATPITTPVVGRSDPSRSDPSRSDPSRSEPGSTAVLDRHVQEREQTTDDGDHDRYAHYVRKDRITQAALDGTPVIALCGKVWVPGRQADKYPVCPECKEIYEGMREPNDGDGGSGGKGSGGGFRGLFGGRR